jgi:hypothetical protein
MGLDYVSFGKGRGWDVVMWSPPCRMAGTAVAAQDACIWAIMGVQAGYSATHAAMLGCQMGCKNMVQLSCQPGSLSCCA